MKEVVIKRREGREEGVGGVEMRRRSRKRGKEVEEAVVEVAMIVVKGGGGGKGYEGGDDKIRGTGRRRMDEKRKVGPGRRKYLER